MSAPDVHRGHRARRDRTRTRHRHEPRVDDGGDDDAQPRGAPRGSLFASRAVVRGMPAGAPAARRAVALFGCEFFLSYGMTECCGKIAVSTLSDETRRVASHDEQLDRVCTSGRPFSLVDVRVTHPTAGREVFAAAPGDEASAEVGEVWIRGPTVFGGYWRRPDADEECFDEDGWFNTGDLATVRTDGYVVLVDRKKDMILVGGENVYCSEVEAALPHPAVAQAAAFGVSHPVMGEIVQAAVTLRADAAVDEAHEKTIVGHCRRSLSGYKVPAGVHVMSELNERQRKDPQARAQKTRRGRRAHQTRRLREWRRRRTRRRRRQRRHERSSSPRAASHRSGARRASYEGSDEVRRRGGRREHSRRRRSSPRRRSRARGDHMDFGEERIERVRLGDGVFLRGDRRRRRRRRRARRRAGIPRVRHLRRRRLRRRGRVHDGARPRRGGFCARRRLPSIVSTRRSRRDAISASTRAFATGVAFAARALRAARRVDLDAEDFVGSSASVPSDIVPSSHILAEVRRALIDAGAPADIADDAPLMASGLASAGAAAAHAAMERAFGARLPATLAFDHPTVTDVAAFVHSAVRRVSNDDEAR